MATQNPEYTTGLRDMELPALLLQADDVREVVETPGWRVVVASVEAREARALQQLLNPTAKAEDIPRLRGLLAGLAGMREAAESIVSYAVAAEEKAKSALAREHEHV